MKMQKLWSRVFITAMISIIAVIFAVQYYRSERIGEEADELGAIGQGAVGRVDVTHVYPFPVSVLPVTANFNVSEFKCKDGTPVPVALYGNVYFLMQNLQALREETGLPVFVNSGYRTPAHNNKNGGAKESTHLTAKAADIRIPGLSPDAVKAIIEKLIKAGKMHPGGLKAYGTFTHYDVRGWNARW